ncbi:MAG: hypothetical protein Kow0022_14700 [Phycisphaerales bacterium]
MKTIALAVVAGLGAAAAAQPATYVDLGQITGDTVINGFFDAGEVAWVRFEIPAISAPFYLDFATEGSTNPDSSTADTELGLYDSVGNFVATDDDDGVGLFSVLTFGAGSGLTLGDTFNLGGNGIAEGEDGNLAGGVYWLAIGEFNTTYNASGWSVTGGNEAVNYVLSIYASVPAPASLALLGLGGLVARRRR